MWFSRLAGKIEKNAAAAAANQNSAVINGIGNGITSLNSIAASTGGVENNAQMQNGSLSTSSMGGGGGLLQNNSSDSGSSSTVIESTVTIPGVNGTNMTVSAINGLNMGLKSPYQYLHLTAPSHVPHHQHSNDRSSHPHVPATSSSNSSSHLHASATSSSSSPYQSLPATSKQQQFVSASNSVYQHLPAVSSPYMPPPLPPRVGSNRPYSQLPSESASSLHSLSAGSTLQSCGTPPVLSHILVTDQGQFHTHSSKFPIEVKEAPGRLFSTEPNRSLPSLGPPPPLRFASGSPFLSGSVTLGRGLSGISGLAQHMGTAKGSTLPRSRVPSLADLRPPFSAHVHPQTRHNTVSEDREHLVNAERHSRCIDGIDNPTLIDDSHMPVYRSKGVGGGPHGLHPSGIPAEGTLAGVLPSQGQTRPYESPFTSRPPYHSSQPTIHQQNASHQSQFTRETWMRNSQDQRAGIVELHPQQGHIHMNGHGPHHPVNCSLIPNNSHMEGHHNNNVNNNSSLVNGHHSHLNGNKDNSVTAVNHNNRTAAVDENQVNGAHEQRSEARKDDKWGSLKRGIAAKKYQNFKEKLSNKFSKSDKSEERTNNGPYANDKNGTNQNTISQHNTATSNGNSDQMDATKPHPGSSRDSFRRAIHQSSQNSSHQENIMETNLSNHQPEGLPPQYPRPPQPLPPSSSHAHSSYQPGAPSQHTTHHHHDSVARGLLMRRSGSYHHLSQHHQEAPTWRSHHYSVDNLVDSQVLPSDHTYSGPAVTGSRGQPAGSGGSDSGRRTSSAGNDARVPNPHDTSLDSATSQRQNNQGHSSGNDSEWVDMTDTELQRIMRKSSDNKTGSRLTRRESLASTPPLPPLSPEGTPSPSPRASPNVRSRKHSLSYSSGGLNKPDLLETAGQEPGGQRGVGEGRTGNSSQGSSQSTPRRQSNSHIHHNHNGGKTSTGVNAGSRSIGVSSESWAHRKPEDRRRVEIHNPLSKNSNRVDLGPNEGDLDAGEITSTTDALDLDSMLDGGVTEATSDDDATSAYDPDVHLIRKQLEGLEGMYSEVLKLLGGRRGGRNQLGHVGANMLDSKASRRRLHGSLSSLPSSIVSSRPGRDKRRVIDDRVRKIGRDNGGKTIHKRFQRLESHVVTLARSVAHLSSEMRTQHLMLQEIESIRGELSMLRTGGNLPNNNAGLGNKGNNHNISWESFRAGIPNLSNPGRVKKLTQFFGDEPPLVRIFLRKLGYEKYAGIFEQEKIGMLELPYLSEERLQKIGIPMGPRLRILQESQGPIRKDGNLSVYVV
ncbi:serine-rich adhesin for platelets-like isoform X2 [Palaemon carinicauda]|uniref:serine-rich adhesin for platelets-like isoform X2 n=1 Tax=Palaemon carinicauda TaxID=392227 RepID=UPI0035B5A41E